MMSSAGGLPPPPPCPAPPRVLLFSTMTRLLDLLEVYLQVGGWWFVGGCKCVCVWV